MKRIVAIVCLLAMMTLLLVSCGPNFNQMEKKLKDEGYTVICFTEKDLKDADEYIKDLVEDNSSIKNVLVAFKLLAGKGVTVIEFKTSDAAKKCADALGKKAERVGNVVYSGDEASIKLVK